MSTWMIVAITLFSITAQGMLVPPDVGLAFLTKQPPQDQKDQSNLAIYGCLVGTSRELMRLASICRGPVFSHISETLDGLETIRTRGRQSDFVDQFYRHQDVLNQANILVMASGKWISVRFEILASLFVGAVAFTAVYVSHDAALTGFTRECLCLLWTQTQAQPPPLPSYLDTSTQQGHIAPVHNRNEISSIRKMWALRAGVLALRCSSVTIATLLSVIALVLTEETLTPVNVFMMISFNNMLSICICTFLAFALLDGYEAHASIGRIEEFLLVRNLRVTSSDRSSRKETEIEAKNSCDKKRSSVDFQKKLGDFSIVNELQDETILRVRSLTYKQMERRDSYILQDIELCTTTSSLTVITRPVGSGKSTLLSVIAGEVSFTQGEVSCQGTVAYVPQTTWVFTGTIQDNILFGLSHEEVKYTRVIEACALTDDIQQFPDSDQTLVGQRGVALSGGQRARVSLARAVYANADVYLLDDPLSAVDFKVGQHIFDKCIKELLIGKTRMMVSHHEDHMKDADEVIVLCKGRVMERGSFLELQDKGIFHKTTDPQYKKISTEGNSGGKFVREIENESVRSAGCLVGIESPSKETRSLLTPQEDREIGVISSKLYWNYFRSGMYTWMIVATTLFSVTAQGMLVAPDVWLSFATKQPLQDQKDQSNLAMYGCLVGVSLMFILARTFVLLSCFLLCSERLHDNMVFAILQAPVVFFDSNPVGRILNRFSKDIGCLDEQLPRTFQLAIDALLIVLASTIVPTIINPWLTFVLIPLIVVAIYLSTYYLKTSRELMRLASICRSPVFSHISETLDGLETIRTRGRQSDFVDQFYRHQDLLNQANILVLASGKWISVRFEILASLFVGAVALLAVYVSQDAAFAGLALAYVVQRFGRTHYAVQKTSEVENLMTAVERVFTNTKLGCEPGYVIERRPPENWPNKGNIIFKDVSLTYYLGGSQVLKNIKVNIKGGAKIGVAGRTGAGKSSFVAALMRMPESSGEIIIDGIPIKQINLHETRRCISVLGQSPVLFSGSLRKNLDIIEQFTDADLWQVLKDVQLKEFVKSVHGNLDHEQLENGANISVGERQLICLARVLLQRNKIVVLDEPTANVDPKTEQTIWGVVREKLRDSTVITIAHRLNTIKDCDKVLVLKHGMVAEFDELDTLVNTEEIAAPPEEDEDEVIESSGLPGRDQSIEKWSLQSTDSFKSLQGYLGDWESPTPLSSLQVSVDETFPEDTFAEQQAYLVFNGRDQSAICHEKGEMSDENKEDGESYTSFSLLQVSSGEVWLEGMFDVQKATPGRQDSNTSDKWPSEGGANAGERRSSDVQDYTFKEPQEIDR
ncbi:Multidrug resistance-associated protein 4 [Stylophora pistillata]|uniref:Multidrug resistance-associated protein 4 n=1 Tax=Stylophora pistillata TaxID=50429 RepID=A0A2B4RW89_STYPI|nr:Multidrug resistance-associated protein 4 [Stylophora pistillata]